MCKSKHACTCHWESDWQQPRWRKAKAKCLESNQSQPFRLFYRERIIQNLLDGEWKQHDSHCWFDIGDHVYIKQNGTTNWTGQFEENDKQTSRLDPKPSALYGLSNSWKGGIRRRIHQWHFKVKWDQLKVGGSHLSGAKNWVNYERGYHKKVVGKLSCHRKKLSRECFRIFALLKTLCIIVVPQLTD